MALTTVRACDLCMLLLLPLQVLQLQSAGGYNVKVAGLTERLLMLVSAAAAA